MTSRTFTVLAIQQKGTALINPESILQPDKNDIFILIGTYDAESAFLAEYPS